MDILDEPVDRGPPPRSAAPASGPGGGHEALASALSLHDPAKVAILIGDDVPADAAPGAVALARQLGPGKRIATILCDTGFRYLSTLYNPEWRAAKGLV